MWTYRFKIVEIERAHVTRISADVTNSNHDGICVIIDTDVLWNFDVAIHMRESVCLHVLKRTQAKSVGMRRLHIVHRK